MADQPAPAAPGVIASTEIGAGKPAQAGQPGQILPAESALLGDASKGHPAADRKEAGPDAASASAPASGVFAPTGSGASAASAASTTSATAAGGSRNDPAQRAAPVRKTGFWPVALGGVVAAGVGAAAAIYALPHLPPEWRPTTETAASEQPDTQAIVAAAEDAARRTVTEELAAQPQPEIPAVPEDLAARLEQLEQQLAGQSGDDQLAALQQRLDEQQSRLEEQQARLEDLSARPAFDADAATQAQQQIEAAAAEAESQLEAARAEAQELQDAAAESTRRAEAVAAIASLQAALDRGVTPAEARERLEAVGLDAPEALRAEVPSLTSLQADFPEAARAALRAALRDSSASGQGNLVTNFLRAQTGARSVEAREGDDPDAVLSRADDAVAAGRIDEALTEIQALPPAGREAPAMSNWMSRATAYTQAQAALTDLSSGTN